MELEVRLSEVILSFVVQNLDSSERSGPDFDLGEEDLTHLLQRDKEVDELCELVVRDATIL